MADVVRSLHDSLTTWHLSSSSSSETQIHQYVVPSEAAAPASPHAARVSISPHVAFTSWHFAAGSSSSFTHMHLRLNGVKSVVVEHWFLFITLSHPITFYSELSKRN
jgi:hypothetical protein